MYHIVTDLETGEEYGEELAHSVRIVSGSSAAITRAEYLETTRVISKLGNLGVYECSLKDMYDYYNANRYEIYQKQ